MSDTYEPSIWPRVDLGNGTVAKLAPSGMLKLEQAIGGILEIMYLSPEQVQTLIDYLHQAHTKPQHRGSYHEQAGEGIYHPLGCCIGADALLY